MLATLRGDGLASATVRTRQTLVAALAVVAIGAAGAAGCEPADPTATRRRPAPPATDDVVVLPLAGGYLSSIGTGAVVVDVAGRDGGAVVPAPDRAGSADAALRLPAFDGEAPAPRAAVRVLPAGAAGDPLDPGTQDFAFGADVLLDATSESGVTGSVDDGDNVVQRGLFDDVTQYKLQVDRRRPSCRIKGRDGAVMASSRVELEPGTWYRLLCSRAGAQVAVSVTSWGPDGVPVETVDVATGPTGSMTPEARTVPLSAGGKLLATGAVAASTDQLNGVIDQVVLRVG